MFGAIASQGSSSEGMVIGRGVENDSGDLVYTEDRNLDGRHYDKCLSELATELQIG